MKQIQNMNRSGPEWNCREKTAGKYKHEDHWKRERERQPPLTSYRWDEHHQKGQCQGMGCGRAEHKAKKKKMPVFYLLKIVSEFEFPPFSRICSSAVASPYTGSSGLRRLSNLVVFFFRSAFFLRFVHLRWFRIHEDVLRLREMKLNMDRHRGWAPNGKEHRIGEREKAFNIHNLRQERESADSSFFSKSFCCIGIESELTETFASFVFFSWVSFLLCGMRFTGSKEVHIWVLRLKIAGLCECAWRAFFSLSC